jgi:hypothetical protein
MSLAVNGFLVDSYIEANNTLDEPKDLIKITVRIQPQYVAYLDNVAKNLDLSRTGCAAGLLEHAILDAQSFMRDPAAYIYQHGEDVSHLIESTDRMREDAIRSDVRREVLAAEYGEANN